MNIVVCTDHNYIMPCGVMLYSLLKNNQQNTITFIVVIDESVSEFDKSALMQIVNNFKNIDLQFRNINGNLFDNFPNLGNGVYVSKATYYRLYLPKILPNTIDKVLYLDCDMIIRKDIRALWETDVEGVAAAVALDGMDGLIQLYNRLDYPIEKGYFNAGMMLINLKYWRENHIHERCIDYIEKHYDRIVSHDQDVLNYVLQDLKKNVDITYNFGECFLYKPEIMQFNYSLHRKAIEKNIQDPAIVHYTVSKPWKNDCLNPFRTLFYRYRDETQWKGMPLQKKKYTKKELFKEYLFRLRIMHRAAIYNPFRLLNFELY